VARDPAVFGPLASGLPVSSSKSFLGHAQGAAGILEAIVTLLAMRRGAVPPTMHHTHGRPGSPDDAVSGDRPRPHVYRAALSVSSAFGGANAVVALGLPGMKSVAARRRRVMLAGLGAVLPGGARLAEDRPLAGRVADCDLAGAVPAGELRGLDPSARFLTRAALDALADGGVVLDRELKERAGLVVGAIRPSPEAVAAFRRSIRERGLARLSVPAFTRLVANAATGTCCRLLSLKGPTSTLTVGAGSGLFAIAYAAELLAWQDSADLILGAGVDELASADEPGAEGAACALLASGERASRATIEVAGWGFAGPGEGEAAVAGALAAAGLERAPAMVIDGGPSPACAAALALLRAAAALRRGEADSALVASSAGSAASTAIVLRRRP